MDKLKIPEITQTEAFQAELKEQNITINDLTCHQCRRTSTCPCAYDFYNLNDDCLMLDMENNTVFDF